MQVTLNADSVAETRLLAAFMHDLADLKEEQHTRIAEAMNAKYGQVEVAPAVEEPAPAKKSRTKKTEPVTTATEPAESPATTGAATVSTATEPAESQTTEGNAPASTAEPVVESGSSETAEVVTHDTLRAMYGQLVAAGKRDGVVAAVKSFGVNAIKDIPTDKLAAVHAAMKAVA